MRIFRRSSGAKHWSLALLLSLSCAQPLFSRVHHSNDWARTQFSAAERVREALNGRPADDRTRREYQRVINAYRRVYFGAPSSGRADASVVAVAELMVEMGRRFENRTTLRAAIKQYEFLRREYPGSRYRYDALFTIAEIYQDDLGYAEKARDVFEEFLRRYPRHRLAQEARNSLHEPLQQASMLSKDEMEAINPEDSGNAGKSGGTAEPLKNGKLPRVTAIRHWSTPDYTRVAIDVEQDVKYQSQRIDRPDRIFFDLIDTKVASTLVGKNFDVDDGFLRKIRIAQFQPGKTRVVLEVDNLSDYDAFLLPNPTRLIIDIHGRGAHPKVATAAAGRTINSGERNSSDTVILASGASKAAVLPVAGSNQSTAGKLEGEKGKSSKSDTSGILQLDKKGNAPGLQPVKNEPASSPSTKKIESPRPVTFAKVENPPMPEPLQGNEAEKKKGEDRTESVKAGVKKKVVEADDDSGEQAGSGSHPSNKHNATKVIVAKLDPPVLKPALKDSITADGDNSFSEIPAAKPSQSHPASAKSSKKGKLALPEPEFDFRESQPTASGDRSLIRALGLKIGKIVIDPGHGGHDAGTIGPNGLREKDLVLDVGRRLGKLLRTRLGAEVVYTRNDDTFIPLETRTAIANQEQSDLFVSIHANSSHDPDARGVETYYLNFTSSSEALEVAARENAVSDKSIHELQDLVKKIALKEKIEESREFASDVQRALHTGLSTRNPGLRNRGVKKAPFIVLIGANMPSILAEISFVSNPDDERKLETPEYRQKIAESLYRGISKYVGGLSGVKVASKMEKGASQ